MMTIQRSIEVHAPLTETFNQWTHFEEFPQFMEGIDDVRRIDDRHLHWRANIAGRTEEWDAEITQLIPNQVVAWRSTNGAANAGMVHFEPSGRSGTRVDVRIEYEPHSRVERLGVAMGVLAHRIEGDLKRFKHVVENPGAMLAHEMQMHGSELNQRG